MIGLAIAAYVVLSIFDHAARADEGVTDPLGNAVKTLEPQGRTSPAPVVEKRVVPALKANDHRVSTVRGKARKVLRADAARTPARHRTTAAAVTGRLKAPKLTAERATVVRRALAAVPALPALPAPPVAGMLPTRPVPLPAWPVAGTLPTQPALPPVPLPHAPPAAPLLSASAPIATAAAVFFYVTAARVRCDLAEHHDGAARSPAPTMPPPTSPPRPGDRSADAAHLRDYGGGAAPPMGTVPSSWWPELPAAAVPLPADAGTSGRNVRYCGPPS
jgi:hypothetical protein